MKDDFDWDDIQTDYLNANAGTDRGGEALRDSIQKRGISKAPVLDKNGVPIAGSKTLEAAHELGFKLRRIKVAPDEIIVTQRDDLDVFAKDDPRGRDLSIADNRVAQINLDHTKAMLDAAVKFQGATAVEELWWLPEREAMTVREEKQAAKEEAAADAEQTPIKLGDAKPTRYVTVVTCKDDTEQAELIDLCEERGWKWRNP